MKCLNCNTEMTNHLIQTKKDQISYDLCEACGSLWLDRGELDKMAFQVNGSIEYCSTDTVKDTSEPHKKCPRCKGITLDKVSFIGSEVTLDSCKNCGGFWLDGGELDLVNKELQDIMPIKGKGFSEFVNNVHLPYWYKRVRRKSTETDFIVEVPPIKGAKLESETEYICPACEDNLNVYRVFKIKVEGCPKCKGIFLDKNELRKLKDKINQDTWQTLSWMDDEVEAIEKANAFPSKRLCPKCNRIRMISTAFSDSKIIIEWCPKCHGLWLDRDEFQEITDNLRDKLNKLSSDEMKKKVLEEIKEVWSGQEGTISEILDAKAAISALINIKIFEHPALANTLMKLSSSIPIR